MERIAEYLRKCVIVRQIQSNKARYYRVINTVNNISTVFVSSLLTFMGFSGLEKIHAYVGLIGSVDKAYIEIVFNLLIFALFVLTILHLIFRFGSKQAEAERAIVSITNMINQLEDELGRSEMEGMPITYEQTNLVRQRYEMLIQTIPANSDREYLKARKDFNKKESEKKPLHTEPTDLFDEARQESLVKSVIRGSEEVMRILETLRDSDERFFLGGGLVRNMIWDYLHGFKHSTPIEDVDVIYFDEQVATKERDHQLEETLQAHNPNVRWSVKNQARMHERNGDEAYKSISDAVSKWPETATAFLVRLSTEGQLVLVAPYAFSDLVRLLVTPTPRYQQDPTRVLQRVKEKEWKKRWPKLRLLGMAFFNAEE